MEILTVEQMAQKWGISPRTVQNLCKNGRIPGAIYFGKSWMIPADAERPPDGRRKSADTAALPDSGPQPLVRKSPYLDMTDLYCVPGTADRCIEELVDYPESQALFAAQIAYSRGQIDQVLTRLNGLLDQHTGLYAVVSAGMLLALCAMWKGDLNLWYEAKKHIYTAPCRDDVDRDIVSLTLAASDLAVRATEDFPDWFARGCFDKLHRDAHPAARVYYIKLLFVSAQELAMGRLQLDGVSGLGLMRTLPYIMEPMISQMAADGVIMAEIYLRLMIATAYHQIGDDLRGGDHLDKAIRLCLADGLYCPLAEHRRQLGLFLDEHLAAIDPEALKILKALHKQLHAGWTVIHNAVTQKTVQASLTLREREVARLAAFGLSNKEISRQLSLSEHTVISLVNSAKNKTNAANRRDLGLYI